MWTARFESAPRAVTLAAACRLRSQPPLCPSPPLRPSPSPPPSPLFAPRRTSPLLSAPLGRPAAPPPFTHLLPLCRPSAPLRPSPPPPALSAPLAFGPPPPLFAHRRPLFASFRPVSLLHASPALCAPLRPSAPLTPPLHLPPPLIAPRRPLSHTPIRYAPAHIRTPITYVTDHAQCCSPASTPLVDMHMAHRHWHTNKLSFDQHRLCSPPPTQRTSHHGLKPCPYRTSSHCLIHHRMIASHTPHHITPCHATAIPHSITRASDHAPPPTSHGCPLATCAAAIRLAGRPGYY